MPAKTQAMFRELETVFIELPFVRLLLHCSLNVFAEGSALLTDKRERSSLGTRREMRWPETVKSKGSVPNILYIWD